MPIFDVPGSPGTSITVDELVEETRRILMGSQREQLNRLTNALNTTATTLTFDFDVQHITKDAFIAVDDEVMFVFSVDKTAKTAVVHRGVRGSTAEAHDAGALVEVNPRFSRFDIKRALRNEIRSWPSSVFAVAYVDVTTSISKRDYNLAGETGIVYRLLDVRVAPTSGVLSSIWSSVPARFEQSLPTGSYSSSRAVVLDRFPENNLTMRILYARPFDLSTFDDGTTIGDIGMREQMADIPPIGAAWRLMMGRETRRVQTETQGEPRHAEEVPVRAIAAASEDLRRSREQRLVTEGLRLLEEFPIKGG